MKHIKRSLSYIQVTVLLIILQNALGIEETPSFLQKKKMLKEMNITLHPRADHFKDDKSYSISHSASGHNYNVKINEPDLCSKHKRVFLLILYRTVYAHAQWRQIIRELLTHRSPIPDQRGVIVKHLFVFGKSDDPQMERLIWNESKHHRDIIQVDFDESYYNLTQKEIAAWEWTVNFCPNTEYVMILNDDVLIDRNKIIDFLLLDYSIGHHDDRFALCYPRINRTLMFLELAHNQTTRRNSLDEDESDPPYCRGWAYVAHIKVINKLYGASFSNRIFMPTDVWVGILSERLRIKILDYRDRYVLYEVANYFADPLYYTFQGMIAVTDVETRNHELEVMESVIRSMRRHWKNMDNSLKQLFAESDPYFLDYNFELYVSISIFICFVIVILYNIQQLKSDCCINPESEDEKHELIQ